MNLSASNLLSTFHALRKANVRYQIGSGQGKAKRLSDTPANIKAGGGLDCSGFTQYLLYHATNPGIRIPSGSWHQEEFFRRNAQYTEVPYSDHAWKNDDVVRIAFRDKHGTKIRHVWLVINSFTYECTKREDRNGPTNFHWSKREDAVDNFFVVGPAANFLMCELTGDYHTA